MAINGGLGMFAQPNWIKRLVMSAQLDLGLGISVVGTKFKSKENEFP